MYDLRIDEEDHHKMTRRLNCMIISDDDETIKWLNAYARQTGAMCVLHADSDVKNALDRLQWLRVNVLVVDIGILEANCEDLVAQPRDRVCGNVPGIEPLKVILCGHDQAYPLDTLDFHVTAYLSKPFSFKKLTESITLVRRELMLPGSDTRPAGNTSFLLIRKDRAEKIRVDFDDIIYLEADDGHCRIHVGENKFYTAKQPLKVLLLKLPRGQFVQIHKSFAVSYDYIAQVTLNSVKLRHIDERIPIGDRNNYPEFVNWCEANTV